MEKVSQIYRKNITEVYKIITMLSDEERAKIPDNVIEFFKENSIEHLLENMPMNEYIIEHELSLTTRKFLKIIAFYLEKK